MPTGVAYARAFDTIPPGIAVTVTATESLSLVADPVPAATMPPNVSVAWNEIDAEPA